MQRGFGFQGFGFNRPSSVPLAGWWAAGALIDADFEGARFYHQGRIYYSVASFAAALGGTNSGNVLSIGPYAVSTLYQSDFSSGVDGWVEQSGFESAGDISAVGGAIRLTQTGNYRIKKVLTGTAGRAYDATLACSAKTGTTGGALVVGQAVTASGNSAFVSNPIVGQSLTVVSGTTNTTVEIGIHSTGSGTIDYSSARVREVAPYAGFSADGLSFKIDATMPAAASGNKVLAQWGCDDEDYRVRLVFDASAVLRLIVTNGNVEQANLSLATVDTSTRYTVSGTVAANAAHGNLNGGPLVSDTSATMPPLGKFWSGRSFTGETFDGTIHRTRVWAYAPTDPNELIEPTLAFRIYGDSTADGAGSTTDWYQNLVADYTPDRSYAKNCAGGESSTQMLARVTADTAVYRNWTTIFMDLANTGESSATWIANIKAAVAYLGTNRWYVHPPVQDAPGDTRTNVSEIQALLLSDPFFDGHTLDASDQADYITAMSDTGTRSDGIHDNDTGATVRSAAIKSFLDAQGW